MFYKNMFLNLLQTFNPIFYIIYTMIIITFIIIFSSSNSINYSIKFLMLLVNFILQLSWLSLWIFVNPFSTISNYNLSILGFNLTFGIDNIALVFIELTLFIFTLCFFASNNNKKDTSNFFIFLLTLELCLILIFASLDVFVFVDFALNIFFSSTILLIDFSVKNKNLILLLLEVIRFFLFYLLLRYFYKILKNKNNDLKKKYFFKKLYNTMVLLIFFTFLLVVPTIDNIYYLGQFIFLLRIMCYLMDYLNSKKIMTDFPIYFNKNKEKNYLNFTKNEPTVDLEDPEDPEDPEDSEDPEDPKDSWYIRLYRSIRKVSKSTVNLAKDHPYTTSAIVITTLTVGGLFYFKVITLKGIFTFIGAGSLFPSGDDKSNSTTSGVSHTPGDVTDLQTARRVTAQLNRRINNLANGENALITADNVPSTPVRNTLHYNQFGCILSSSNIPGTPYGIPVNVSLPPILLCFASASLSSWLWSAGCIESFNSVWLSITSSIVYDGQLVDQLNISKMHKLNVRGHIQHKIIADFVIQQYYTKSTIYHHSNPCFLGFHKDPKQLLWSNGFGFFLEEAYTSKTAGINDNIHLDKIRPDILKYHETYHFIVLWETNVYGREYPVLYKCAISSDSFVFNLANYKPVDENDKLAGRNIKWYFDMIKKSKWLFLSFNNHNYALKGVKINCLY